MTGPGLEQPIMTPGVEIKTITVTTQTIKSKYKNKKLGYRVATAIRKVLSS